MQKAKDSMGEARTGLMVHRTRQTRHLTSLTTFHWWLDYRFALTREPPSRAMVALPRKETALVGRDKKTVRRERLAR